MSRIRYIGDLTFKEIPGGSGPTQGEGVLDTLVRKYRGNGTYYNDWKPKIGTPDFVHRNMYVTDVQPVFQDAGMIECLVTFKGLVYSAAEGASVGSIKLIDSTTVKSSTVNADYVYTQVRGYTYWGSSFNPFIGSMPALAAAEYVAWLKIPISVQASYYAPSTTYKYVSATRPLAPAFGGISSIETTAPPSPQLPNGVTLASIIEKDRFIKNAIDTGTPATGWDSFLKLYYVRNYITSLDQYGNGTWMGNVYSGGNIARSINGQTISGVNGFSNPLTFFNISTSGNVNVPSFSFSGRDAAVFGTNPGSIGAVQFQRLDLQSNQREIICSSFNAERFGVFWECSETWEVEIKPSVGQPTSGNVNPTAADPASSVNTIATANSVKIQSTTRV